MSRESRSSRRSRRNSGDDGDRGGNKQVTRRSRPSNRDSGGSNDNSKKTSCRIVTGKCRSSYMFCTSLQEKEGQDGSKYKIASTRVLIPKRDKKKLEEMRKAIERAAVAKFGRDVNIKSRKFNYPLRDGDEELEDGEVSGKEYENHYFMNTKCYDRLPKVVGPDAVAIEDRDELMEVLVSGYYFYFSITFKAFDNESKGVRVELNNIMFLEEGDRLDNTVNAEDEFADYAQD